MNKLEFLRNSYPEKEVFLLDAGVHIGWFTFNAAVRGFKVIGWEPGNNIREKARFNMCLNGPGLEDRVRILDHGLGANDSDCYFYRAKGYNLGLVSCTDQPRVFKGEQTEFLHKIKMQTLDQNLDILNEDSVAVMKIDCEGFETWILEGGEQFFAKHRVPYIVAEYS